MDQDPAAAVEARETVPVALEDTALFWGPWSISDGAPLFEGSTQWTAADSGVCARERY